MSEIIKINTDFKSNYTKTPNQVSRNSKLTGLAKAIYTYIHSCAPGWEITLKDIKRHFADSMHAIRKAVQELNKAGLLRFKNKKDDYNRFIGKVWMLFGPAETIDKTESEPCVGSRNHGSPNHGETARVNNTLSPKDSLSKTLNSPDQEKEKEEDLNKEFVKPVGKIAELKARAKRLAELAKSPAHLKRLQEHEKAEARLETFKKQAEESVSHQYKDYIDLGINGALDKLCEPFKGKANAYYLKKMKAFFKDDKLIAPLVDSFNLSKDAKTLKYVIAVWNDKQADHGRIHT